MLQGRHNIKFRVHFQIVALEDAVVGGNTYIFICKRNLTLTQLATMCMNFCLDGVQRMDVHTLHNLHYTSIMIQYGASQKYTVQEIHLLVRTFETVR